LTPDADDGGSFDETLEDLLQNVRVQEDNVLLAELIKNISLYYQTINRQSRLLNVFLALLKMTTTLLSLSKQTLTLLLRTRKFLTIDT
jgi:hypothetical protein